MSAGPILPLHTHNRNNPPTPSYIVRLSCWNEAQRSQTLSHIFELHSVIQITVYLYTTKQKNVYRRTGYRGVTHQLGISFSQALVLEDVQCEYYYIDKCVYIWELRVNQLKKTI